MRLSKLAFICDLFRGRWAFRGFRTGGIGLSASTPGYRLASLPGCNGRLRLRHFPSLSLAIQTGLKPIGAHPGNHVRCGRHGRFFCRAGVAVFAWSDHTGRMLESSNASNAHAAERSVVGSSIPDPRVVYPRAIFRGTMVGAGGALVVSTIIGVAAVLGMAGDGLSPQTIAHQLRSQWDLRLLLAAGELLMAMLAGYTAAITAGRGELRHAAFASVGTLVLNLLVIATCGSPLPVWLAATGLSLTMPCAMLGGYLASPAVTRPKR